MDYLYWEYLTQMCGAAPRGSNGIHPLRSARSKPGLCFAVQDGGPTVTPDFGF